MKTEIKNALLTAVLLAGTISLRAQTVTPPPAPAPEPLLAAGRLPMPPHPGPGPLGLPPVAEPQQLVKLTTIKGTVVNAIANDRFEYNALLVKTSTGNITVMFPPHMGEQILAKAKDGAAVTVTGSENVDPTGKKVFHLNSIEVNGSMVTDTPPVAPQVDNNREVKTFNSIVKELVYGPEKNVNGFILSSGERVNIPPHIAQQLGSLLKVNEKIGVTGFVETKRPGVVYSQKMVMVGAQTLNLNGQTYLVR